LQRKMSSTFIGKNFLLTRKIIRATEAKCVWKRGRSPAALKKKEVPNLLATRRQTMIFEKKNFRMRKKLLVEGGEALRKSIWGRNKRA